LSELEEFIEVPDVILLCDVVNELVLLTMYVANSGGQGGQLFNCAIEFE
jgi:hypothetical protein